MSISVTCEGCRRRFQATDKLAGKKAKCPRCGEVIPVPETEPPQARTSSSAGSPGEEEAAAEFALCCSSCHARLASDAVLCVRCGTDQRTGRQVEASPASRKAVAVDGEETERPVVGTASETGREAVWRTLVLVLLLGVVASVSAGLGWLLAAKLDPSFMGIAPYLRILVSLPTVFYFLKLAAEAFFDNVLSGLLFIFLPFYWIYYLASNWDDLEGMFLPYIICFGGWWFCEGMCIARMAHIAT